MGRKLKITVRKATGLTNADAEEGGHSDPFVLVCFDNKVDQELGRTETVENSTEPEWNHEFEVDVTEHIQSAIDATGEEPKMITFCVYDQDAGEAEPLGVAGVAFEDLVKRGKWEGETPVYMGQGAVDVSVEMKKAKFSSMLKDDTALKVAGGVAGAAAVGALGYYLFNRYQKKKQAEEENEVEEDGAKASGMMYGYNVDDDDDEDDDKDTMKKWWEMDDEDDDEDEENEDRWSKY